MARSAAQAPKAAAGPRRRLSADARRSLILKAARRAFTESGDVSGTTIRAIADKAGISEALIYRHFESKEQLYVEAVVGPLRDVVDLMIAQAGEVRDADVNSARGLHMLSDLNDKLVATLEEVLPLLGMVLFGDPKLARRFYREKFAVALDRMAESWQGSVSSLGLAADNADLAVRALVGNCLMVALELRFNPRFDRDRAVGLVTRGIASGFLPPEAVRGPRRKAPSRGG